MYVGLKPIEHGIVLYIAVVMIIVMVFIFIYKEMSKVRKEYNNNKGIVNVMRKFVIISKTIVHCAIGTQHDF